MMKRRALLQAMLAGLPGVVISGCGRALLTAPEPGVDNGGGVEQATPAVESGGRVMTVNGWVEASQLGLTLAHEHLHADLRPAAEQLADPITPDVAEVLRVVLPQLRRISTLGCRTLVDCTASNLGRDAALLKTIADASGMNLITMTGAYLSADLRFATPHMLEASSDDLATRWIGEWRNGIDDSGVRPGMIKLGVNGGALTAAERRLFEAGIRTHRETGLTIGVHVGPWHPVDPGYNARSALDQLAMLDAAGLSPSAWIWIHTQNEPDPSFHLQLARRGAWISLDGFRPGQSQRYLDWLAPLRADGRLGQVLLSQDAGWYNAGVPGGGDFNPFDPILIELLPALATAGYSQSEIDTLFVRNPARALTVAARERS